MNKKRKILSGIAVGLLMVTLVTTCNQGVLLVDAGVSEFVVDNSSFEKELNESKWTAPNNDITVKAGKLVFPTTSTGETRLITNKAIKLNEYWDELFRTEYTMTIQSMPSGKQFMAAFALSDIEAYSGEKGNVELVFQNNNGLKVGLVAYKEDGKKTTLASMQSLGASVGQELTVSAKASKDMKFTILVNGKTIYDAVCPVALTGRMGFLQTGSCGVEISKLNIVSYQYDRPENVNFSEDFEKGTMNIKALTSLMNLGNGSFPTKLAIEDYNGSKVLMWQNVAMGYIGTMYEYSNFEMTFDVPYILHKNVYRKDGTILTKKNEGFVISIGDDNADYEASSYEIAGDSILFTSSYVQRLKGDKVKADFSDKAYYDVATNDGYSVKLKVVDKMATVYMKSIGAKKYDEILNYKIGDITPSGFIHIWAYGSGNFALDNISVTNLDKEANLVKLEYEAGYMKGTEDWVYEPEKVIYRDGSTPDESTNVDSETDSEDVSITDFITIENTKEEPISPVWIWLGIIETIVGLALVTFAIIYLKKQKVKKEGAKDEV